MPGARIKGASSNLCLSFSSQCEWDQWLLNTRGASALSCYATNTRVYVLRKLSVPSERGRAVGRGRRGVAASEWPSRGQKGTTPRAFVISNQRAVLECWRRRNVSINQSAFIRTLLNHIQKASYKRSAQSVEKPTESEVTSQVWPGENLENLEQIRTR